jgi:ankyrin repeat protein
VLCTGYRGDAEKVQELVNMKANLHSTDALGNSPLHLAAFNGHIKVIRSPPARASECRRARS